MPALVPVRGVARCAFRGTAAGVNIVNVIHMQKDPVAVGGYSQAEIDALSNSMASIWVTRILPLLSAAYVASEVVCTDLTSNLGVVGSKTMAGSGTHGASSSPNSVACCAGWKIPRHYRGGHPRIYLGPLSTTANSSGTTLSPTYTALVTTNLNSMLADFNAIAAAGAPYKMIVLHRLRAGVVLNPVEFSFPTGAVCDNRIDSQRRRLGPDR